MKPNFHLMVVDDDNINIFIIKKLIEKTGYPVTITPMSNGELAIDLLKNCLDTSQPLPDLIFLDINMPIMTGWEFLNEYEVLPIENDIPIYMLSSSIFENDMEKAKNFKNVKNFISKPISNQQLIDIFIERGLTLPS